MTTTAAPATSWSGIFRALSLLGVLLAAAALLLLAAGPVGWRAGWWNYRVGSQTLMPWAGYLGVAAIGVSALALGTGWRRLGRQGIVLAVLGLLIGAGASYFPWHWSQQRGTYPRVNDVTTDFENPPSLAFSQGMRKAEDGNGFVYARAAAEPVQSSAYPDITRVLLDMAPAQAFERAMAVVRAKRWTVVRSDPADGIIEAYDRSFWFGFTDDIAIRVSPAGEESRVDIRSSARQGRGDYGVNAARVRGFLAALKGQ